MTINLSDEHLEQLAIVFFDASSKVIDATFEDDAFYDVIDGTPIYAGEPLPTWDETDEDYKASIRAGVRAVLEAYDRMVDIPF